MKIAFFGTPEPAAAVLDTLIKAKHEIGLVVTQPDRPKGRGQKVAFSPVKELALKHALLVAQPDALKQDAQFAARLKAAGPDIAVVVAYGKLLPKELLAIPRHGFINLHASLLPKYRGAAPIQWALLKGEKETGVTIFQLTELLDAGPVILQKKVGISEDDDAASLSAKLFTAGQGLLLESLTWIARGTAKFVPQDEAAATFAPSLSKESGEIDWRKSAREINDRIRALVTWPVAHTFYRGKRLKLLSSQPHVIDLAGGERLPGMVVALVKGEGFIIATGQGDLLVRAVQPEAGKRMNAYDFVIGHGVRTGESLPN